MNYTVDIIDMENSGHTVQVERSLKSSVILNWQGADKKDDKYIIGSSLSFTMVSLVNDDGYYYDLFTGNETRYKVRLYDDNNTTIWLGHLLPDSYSEPYESAPIVVDFMATDGLGRLKGKYLPDMFYKEEKSVISIIAACLRLTETYLNFRFSPAIENYQQKDYNQIYIDTAKYIDEDKKEDAHTILEDLLESMGCVLFQADHYYNIEGLNVREQRAYKTKIYSNDGIFIEEQEITRNSKTITGLATPLIVTQPPYGVIDITHEQIENSFPEGLSEETNDGWIEEKVDAWYDENLVSEIYATEWQGRNGFFAKARDGVVYFERKTDNGLSPQFINIRNRPYVEQGKKYKIVLTFSIYGDVISDSVWQTIQDNELWKNPFDFTVSVGTDEYYSIVFSNNLAPSNVKYRELLFEDRQDKKATFSETFIPNESGVLDVTIYPIDLPGGLSVLVNAVGWINIDELTLEELGFSDTSRYLNLLDGYTLKKELDVEWADDVTGKSKAFRLAKLNEPNQYTEIEIPVIRKFTFKGVVYSVVDLKGANLAKENINFIYDTLGNLIDVKDVIYNYNNSQEHVILTDFTIDIFVVRVYDYNSVIQNRDHWEQWTDSIYKVEKIRHVEALGNIYTRSFDKPKSAIQSFTVKNNIKFNDFINFTYRNKNRWIVNNCRWDIDRGHTDITLSENYYAIEQGANIPPIVEAGNDVFIAEDQTEFTIHAEAFDPDGFITSYEWESIPSGSATMYNRFSDTVTVRFFNADFGTLKVEVTDNDGATSTDTVNIYRIKTPTLSLELINEETGEGNLDNAYGSVQRKRIYKVVFDPTIPEGFSVNIKGTIKVESDKEHPGNGFVDIDGVRVADVKNYGPSPRESEFSLNYITGTDITITLHSELSYQFEDGYCNVSVEISEAEFIDGTGDILGIPLYLENKFVK